MKHNFRMGAVFPFIVLTLIMAMFIPCIYSGDNIPQKMDYTQLLIDASWIVDHVLTGEYKVSRLKEAISKFNEVLEINKDESEAYFGLGEAYYLQAQEANKISKRYWDKAIQIDPGIKEEIQTIKKFNIELTVLEEQLKNVDEEGRQEQEQSLKDVKYVMALVELTEEFSEILSREDPLNQNFSPIIEHGLELIKSNPDEPVSYFIVGNLYYLSGNELKADEYWDNAINLDRKFAIQIDRQKNLLNMVVKPVSSQ